jgi:hypothetical protein
MKDNLVTEYLVMMELCRRRSLKRTVEYHEAKERDQQTNKEQLAEEGWIKEWWINDQIREGGIGF